MATFNESLASALAPFPPYLPGGFRQLVPFAIRRDNVEIVPVVSNGPCRFGVRFDGDFGRAWLDGDLVRHYGVPPYKLQNPPTFASFDEAVRVASAYLGNN